MNSGYRVHYDNEDQICIVPNPSIPTDVLCKLFEMYRELGYSWWLLPDDRQGYILSKKERNNG